MLLENKQIAIVGGGPGGLTLARLLQNKGANVKVYERDKDRNVRVQGATLDLHFENGLKAIEACGLMDAFKATYRPDNDRYRVVDKDGTILHDDHDKVSTGDFGDEWFRPEIDRGPLRDILLDSLAEGTVVWDSHIVSLEKVDRKWHIIFQNGSTETADIVIGADGANSKIRATVTPIKSYYSGITFLTGNIENSETNAPQLHQLVKGGKISGMGDSKTIFLSEKGDGSLDFYIGFKAASDWASKTGLDFTNGQQMLEWFKTEYAGWGDMWLELFQNEQTIYIPRPLNSMPLDQHWEAQPDITLLGDAAHLLPPNGEGVNSAMLDALELSENLTSGRFTDLKYAIADFEQRMFERFVKEGVETADFMEWTYSPDGLSKMVGLFNEMPV